MHACVIGAGIIGVTTAHRLAREGWRVTLVDAAAEPAAGASHANGGQLSYSYVAPLAEPTVLRNLPNWLLRPSSPLRFRPRTSIHQWHWCLQFLRACNRQTADRTTAELLALARLSQTALADLLEHTPIEFGHRRNGKLIVHRNPRTLDRARRLMEFEASMGVRQEALTAEQCVALEPTLAPLQRDLVGGIHTPDEEAGDCARLTRGLFDELVAMNEVSVRMNMPIRRLETSGGAVRAATSQTGDQIAADHFVVAAGMASRRLLLPFGHAPMLYALKGYSLSMPCTPGTAPEVSVTDYERRTVYVRLGQTLRVAAMVGLGVPDQSIEPERIALIKRQARQWLPQAALDDAHAWAGLRPATPDGKPRIGRSPAARNLWLNLGHGALGFTLACGSSVLLTDLMARRQPAIDPTPYHPLP